MTFDITFLWKAPEVDPINRKARSIPVLNPVNVYGRVFFFSWLGFMVAFTSWYAFPPLISTIKKDLHLSQSEVANSNIVSITATLVVRLFCGPLCDRFGARYIFAGTLILGAVPTALAGTIQNATGLIIVRFFIGVLGASFVPCQVWSTAFFDKNIVGTTNALTGGLGNSGGGITYFLMPAIFNHFIGQNMNPHKAWRVSFFIPFAIIMATAVLMLLLCPDTPTGKWSERENVVKRNLEMTYIHDIPSIRRAAAIAVAASNDTTEKDVSSSNIDEDVEADGSVNTVVNAYTHETVQNPDFVEFYNVAASAQTLALCAAYFCSFGAEIAINSILGSYYVVNFKHLDQTTSGRWAAMFGLLNIYGRPLGGVVGDFLYKYTNGNLWAKKAWVHLLGIMAGVMCIIIGMADTHELHRMVGMVAALAFFMDAGNGANFALVPHVHPYANGIVSGLVGATGNFGGVIVAILFRYNGVHYAKVFWITGIICIAMNIAVCWIRPIPRSQIGGR